MHVAAGLAAGFDKDAAAIKGLLGLGFGFVEVGKLLSVMLGLYHTSMVMAIQGS